MPLSAGTQLGPYEILSPLGAGGMGEVYRAKDSKLDREVAIKILPGAWAQDPERLARFEREAKVLASLNHPNIAQIYGVEERALVIELVEGEAPRGPMPFDDAWKIASQIAAALEYAHDKGIIHRDLKPANIKVTPDGAVKLLDFGLAKAFSPQEPAGKADVENSPTLTIPTEAGMILGTAAYMSPEQASGKALDKRTDIWSFGVVFYQLLTGKKLFRGETVTEIVSSVVKDEPDLSGVPVQARGLLKSCLEKDPKKRLRDIGDVSIAMQPIAVPEMRRRAWLWPAIAGALLVLMTVVALLGWVRASRPEAVSDVSFIIPPPAGMELLHPGSLTIDRISPDGSMVLFWAGGRLRVRRLNSLESEPLGELLDPGGDTCWSPDSQSIALPATLPATGTGIFKVRVPNGGPELIARMPKGNLRGASWGEKGMILLAQGPAGLFAVPAAGGTAQPVEIPGVKEGGFFGPQFLPGGEDFIVLFRPFDTDGAQVYMATLRGGKAVDPQLLLATDTAAAFTPAGGGRLLFIRGDNLYSQKLDQKARKLSGDPELVQDRVSSYAAWRTSYFSVSNNGTLAWRSGTAVVSQVTVFDRKGNRMGVAGRPGPIFDIRLSPDESRLIATGTASAALVDANGPGRVAFTPGRIDSSFFWSPDGARLIYAIGNKLLERSVSDWSQVRQIGKVPYDFLAGISPDGRLLLDNDGTQVSVFTLDGRSVAERIIPHRSHYEEFSPDGKWVVYFHTDEPGVFARPISGARLPTQIADLGARPVWRGDGKEILYVGPLGIWSVAVEGSGDALRFAAPVKLFSAPSPMGAASGTRPLAVNHDGSRIFYLQSPEQPDYGVIRVRTGAIR